MTVCVSSGHSQQYVQLLYMFGRVNITAERLPGQASEHVVSIGYTKFQRKKQT